MKALQNILVEIKALITTTSASPQDRTDRCLELLETATALTNDMMKRASRIQ
jgi:hypothetical protein